MKTLSVKRAFMVDGASGIKVYHGKLFPGGTAKTLIQIMRLIEWFVYHGKLFIRRSVFHDYDRRRGNARTSIRTPFPCKKGSATSDSLSKW